MSDKSTSTRVIQLAVLTVSRLFLNTGLRMVYPFLPAFARGLGVPLATLAALVSLRSAAFALSPLFGPLSERYGRRSILALSMLLFALGCAVIVLWPELWAFGAMLIVVAVAKVIYDPAMQAYIGDTVAYRRRGRALAITELSWAGAFLLGVPLIGWSIENRSWQAPFLFLTIASVGAAPVLWRALPASDGRNSAATTLAKSLQVIRRQRVIWAAALYILLVTLANELLLIIYGDWMESTYALTLSALGLATAVIGAAEVGGELSTAAFIDRIGKRPFVIACGSITVLMYAVMPIVSTSLTTALIALFVLFLFFEMTVVGGIPLMTEIVPAARGVVMSIILAAGGLGRALGALLGPVVWTSGGFETLGLVAAALMLIAVLILAIAIHEAGHQSSHEKGAGTA
ncbi:MAG: MFS transporter [Chloroflexota bacterium]|nr:MAG: MFS transporter [Chloroflexota bacterium]